MVLKKTKISSITILIVLLICTLFLSACNDTIPNDGYVKLDISENYKEYIKSDIPSFTLNFDGNLNTIKNVNKSYYTVFSGNDDIILSDALSKLFEEYSDKVYFEITDTKKSRTREFSYLEDGKVKNKNMVLDDEVSYNEVAYIPLNNGLKLTIDYCRFVSEGKTYYTWCYERSISMYLYYPIMVVEASGAKELKILTVPNRVKIHVTPELRLKNILSKDTYIKDNLYNFSYVDQGSIDSNKAYVWDYYSDYNLSAREDIFTFDYLGNRYEVTLNDDSFLIKWKSLI
ncbi:MAG: hypothetical protein J6W64_11465 [Bacilli bacterium]|nr:hypothetical protein [Bacilli bacterium]